MEQLLSLEMGSKIGFISSFLNSVAKRRLEKLVKSKFNFCVKI